MNQLLAIKDDIGLEEIAQTLDAILKELRTANRREQERDEKREAEKAKVEERYARL